MDWFAYIKHENPELMALPKELLSYVRTLEPSSIESFFASKKYAKQSKELTPTHLRNLISLQWHWKELTRAIARKKNAIKAPDFIWDYVYDDDQIVALEKVGRLLAASPTPPDDNAWLAGLKIWDAAFALARKETRLSCQAIDVSNPRFEHYSDLIGQQNELFKLPAHRWFATLRAEQEKILELTFEYPLKGLEQQVALRCSDLGQIVQFRPTKSLLQELVLDDLDVWLRYKMDKLSRQSATLAACKSYRTLLAKKPLKEDSLVAIYVGHEKGRVGVVVVNSKGEKEKDVSLAPEENLLFALENTLEQWSIKDIAISLRASASKLLQDIIKILNPKYTIHRIREAGISVAREHWLEYPYQFSKEIASAMVLAHRLQRPMKEWSRIDPLVLGLAEYQDMLDEKFLQNALRDEVAILQHIKPKKEVFASKAISMPPSHSPNPSVKRLIDLRAGMTLKGLVSNLTDFGAFVHIGLSEEGLIHLSELADRFVRHPSEVVTVGQEVTVRVLSVDQQSKRISLSMRNPDKPRPRSKQQKKSQALQDLENLFKK